jgi:ankyrin repeat protein
MTPIWLAMKAPSESVVELLVAEDTVDINSENPETGDTPLSWAASNGAFTAVKP